MTSSPDVPSRRRALTPARIVALAAIAAVVAGLAYLHFGTSDDPVVVPAGARAGQLDMHPCHYDTEAGSLAADCGTLVVPENRANPRSRLIALPVTRIRARTAHPGPPLFRLEGGPGKTNMQFADASRYTGERDVVLVGYRGVDGSARLDCPEVISVLKHSRDLLGAASMRARSAAFRDCATRLRADGFDLRGYTLAERVDDFEAARRALGYPQVDLVSESAGTRTAMIYAWRHPRSIQRSVMVAVNPPGRFLWDPKTTDAQIRSYGRLCAKDDACRARTGDLAAAMRRESAHLPDHWGPLPIRAGNVRLASFFGLMDGTSAAAPLAAPLTLRSWLSAAEGDASGMWLLSTMANVAFPEAQVWGDVASVARTDASAADRHFAAAGRDASILRDAGTDFIWVGGAVRNAWPAGPGDDAYRRVRTSAVPTLLVGGELDFATPAQNATKQLLPQLPNGRQVILPGFGHTTDFWEHQPDAGTHLVSTFLRSGRVDASQYRRHTVSFETGTAQTSIAKVGAAAMGGLALFTVLGLVLAVARVRTRGRLGRVTRGALRSVGAVLFGLGGWFAGALVVLVTGVDVPLDDAGLAVASVGVPIGLATYLAWTGGDRSPATKAAGFVAAVAGALVGAWLGHGVVDGLVALVTAIAGAAAAANLALIARDIAAERQARPVAAGSAAPAPVAS